MSARAALLLLALFGCAPAAEPGGDSARAAEPAHRWNVVLVTLDTTRADHLGCYGAAGDPTPNLDAFAASGALFEFCMSTSSVTPVSHASILTGRDPYAHGLRVIKADGGWRLPADVPTLVDALGAAGWRTGAVLSSFTVSEHFGLDRGFQHFDNGFGDGGFRPGPDGKESWDTKTYQRRSDDTVDRALEWIEEGDEPFFLWMHTWDPHDLQMLPPQEVVHEFLPPGERGTRPMEGAAPLEVYAAEVHWVDRQLGRLLDALEAAGRAEDTLVAILADHGEGLGEHDWMGHRLLYQEQMHLPLLLRWPGGPTGVRVDALVRSVDVAPTVLDLLGLPPLPGAQGASLAALAAGAEEPPRLAYADQLNKWDTNGHVAEKRPRDDLLHVLMDRRWKLIHRPTQPEASELFDLANDPDEARNLWRADHPEARRLLAELERRDAYVLEPLPPLDVEGSVDVDGALGALGYTAGDPEDEEDPGDEPE